MKMDSISEKRQLGTTGLFVPPIIFGTSCLGNLYGELPYETKLAIVREWFKYIQPPVVVDCAGKYGAGLALEVIGKALGELAVKPDDIIISNKLAWKRVALKGTEPTFEPGAWVGIGYDAKQAISYDGIMECRQQGNELLGGRYQPQIVSVHDPDEYLASASDEQERSRLLGRIIDGYKALHELKAAGKVKAVGVGAKDWKVIREIADRVQLDWVMFACSLTVYTHSAELLRFVEELRSRGIGIINSAVFNAGFLVGGEYFNYRKADAKEQPELFAWRDGFMRLCRKHNVKPDVACIQFGLSAPGVVAIAVNSSKPHRIRENVESVSVRVSGDFWVAMKEEGLIDRDYPYVG